MLHSEIFSPSSEIDSRIIAFLDIGTNSIRMLLVKIKKNLSYNILNAEKEIVRLGENEFVDQYLLPEAMDRAVLVCKQFVDMASAYEADQVIAIATSATREAKNQKEFIDRIKQETGLDVHTISGREEARLIYLGTVSGLHLENKQALMIDIGGGSTEISVGDQNNYQYLDSLKLGAIRLHSLFFLPEENGPVPPARYALIQRYVRNASVRTMQRVSQYRVDTVIGTSGTIESLAEIAANMYGAENNANGLRLSFSGLEKVVEHLCSLSVEERKKISGLNPSRADIIISGAAILHTLMKDLNIKEIQISDRGLRDGLMEDYILRSEQASIVRGMTVRERSILQLGRSCGFEEPHAYQVSKLATQLFNSSAEIGLHPYGSWEKELLEYAALLHDIGTFLSHTNHQSHTYYLIRNADLLGFDHQEILIIATLAYYHRKKRPKSKQKELQILEKESQLIVKKLSILLQLAESLDRSHAGVIYKVGFENTSKKEITLKIHASTDCQLEIWGVHNQKKNFKKTFKKKLLIHSNTDQISL